MLDTINIVGTQGKIIHSVCPHGDAFVCRYKPLVLCGSFIFPYSIIRSMLLGDLILCPPFSKLSKALLPSFFTEDNLTPWENMSKLKRISTCSDPQIHPAARRVNTLGLNSTCSVSIPRYLTLSLMFPLKSRLIHLEAYSPCTLGCTRGIQM